MGLNFWARPTVTYGQGAPAPGCMEEAALSLRNSSRAPPLVGMPARNMCRGCLPNPAVPCFRSCSAHSASPARTHEGLCQAQRLLQLIVGKELGGDHQEVGVLPRREHSQADQLLCMHWGHQPLAKGMERRQGWGEAR